MGMEKLHTEVQKGFGPYYCESTVLTTNQQSCNVINPKQICCSTTRSSRHTSTKPVSKSAQIQIYSYSTSLPRIKEAVSQSGGWWALQEPLRCEIDGLVSKGERRGSSCDWSASDATGSKRATTKANRHTVNHPSTGLSLSVRAGPLHPQVFFHQCF